MNILDARRRTLGTDVFKRTEEGNPVSVKSVARRNPGITMQGWTEQDSTNGYQLFDASLLSSHSAGGATVTNNGDGSFTISGEGQLTSIFNVEHVLTHEESINLLKVGKIRLKSDVSTSPYLRVGIENYYLTTREIDANRVIDITQDMLDDPQFTINLRIYANNADTIIPGTVKPMLYQDGDGTWEPYTGGQPSPSPDYPQEIISSGSWDETAQKWEYEINMAGAQLFDESDIQVVSVDPEGTQRNGFEITGLKPGQYTISTKQKTIGKIAYLYANVKNSSGEYGKIQYIVTNASIDTVVISISSGDALIIYDASSSNSMEVSKSIFAEYGIMLNIGSVALPYQPYYTPQSITLQSDRPLTKWDRLEKRNGQWGWVYKSAEAVFDGSEEWSLYPIESVGTVFYTDLPNASFGLQTSLCDKYRNINYAWDARYNGVFGIYSDNALVIDKYFRPPSAAVETVEQWKAWLSENPLTLWYETEVETFVPLTAAEREAMNALYTYRPTTVLSNQQDCEMALTYKTRKSMEVTA